MQKDHLVGGDCGGVPRHEHDCDDCVFLGQCGEFDLYFHEGKHPIQTTLIARDGPRGDYCSGLGFSVPYTMVGQSTQQPAFPELAEARARAIAAGYGPAIDKAEGGAA